MDNLFDRLRFEKPPNAYVSTGKSIEQMSPSKSCDVNEHTQILKAKQSVDSNVVELEINQDGGNLGEPSGSEMPQKPETSFVIPKKKRKSTGLLVDIKINSREFQHDILPAVTKSFRHSQSIHRFHYNRIQIVNNPELTETFMERRKELRLEGYSEKEVLESFAFLCVNSKEDVIKICRDGIRIGNSKMSCLGHPEMGVQLCRHADIIRPASLRPGDSGYIVIFKVVKGRIKPVAENRSTIYLEPTPNFDCHVSSTASTDLSSYNCQSLYESTQIYLYQYGDEGAIDVPKNICPFAVLNFTYSRSPKKNKSLDISTGSKSSTRLHSPKQIPSSPSTPKEEESFFVWDGKLTVKGLYACNVEMKSFARYTKPARIGKDINITHKMGISQARQKYLNHVTGIKRRCEGYHNGFYLNVCELQPCSPAGKPQFQKVMNYLGKYNCVAVKKLEKDVTLLLLSANELTFQLGLTKPHQYPVTLYCLFLSKKSCKRERIPLTVDYTSNIHPSAASSPSTCSLGVRRNESSTSILPSSPIPSYHSSSHSPKSPTKAMPGWTDFKELSPKQGKSSIWSRPHTESPGTTLHSPTSMPPPLSVGRGGLTQSLHQSPVQGISANTWPGSSLPNPQTSHSFANSCPSQYQLSPLNTSPGMPPSSSSMLHWANLPVPPPPSTPPPVVSLTPPACTPRSPVYNMYSPISPARSPSPARSGYSFVSNSSITPPHKSPTTTRNLQHHGPKSTVYNHWQPWESPKMAKNGIKPRNLEFEDYFYVIPPKSSLLNADTLKKEFKQQAKTLDLHLALQHRLKKQQHPELNRKSTEQTSNNNDKNVVPEKDSVIQDRNEMQHMLDKKINVQNVEQKQEAEAMRLMLDKQLQQSCSPNKSKTFKYPTNKQGIQTYCENENKNLLLQQRRESDSSEVSSPKKPKIEEALEMKKFLNNVTESVRVPKHDAKLLSEEKKKVKIGSSKHVSSVSRSSKKASHQSSKSSHQSSKSSLHKNRQEDKNTAIWDTGKANKMGCSEKTSTNSTTPTPKQNSKSKVSHSKEKLKSWLDINREKNAKSGVLPALFPSDIKCIGRIPKKSEKLKASKLQNDVEIKGAKNSVISQESSIDASLTSIKAVDRSHGQTADITMDNPDTACEKDREITDASRNSIKVNGNKMESSEDMNSLDSYPVAIQDVQKKEFDGLYQENTDLVDGNLRNCIENSSNLSYENGNTDHTLATSSCCFVSSSSCNEEKDITGNLNCSLTISPYSSHVWKSSDSINLSQITHLQNSATINTDNLQTHRVNDDVMSIACKSGDVEDDKENLKFLKCRKTSLNVEEDQPLKKFRMEKTPSKFPGLETLKERSKNRRGNSRKGSDKKTEDLMNAIYSNAVASVRSRANSTSSVHGESLSASTGQDSPKNLLRLALSVNASSSFQFGKTTASPNTETEDNNVLILQDDDMDYNVFDEDIMKNENNNATDQEDSKTIISEDTDQSSKKRKDEQKNKQLGDNENPADSQDQLKSTLNSAKKYDCEVRPIFSSVSDEDLGLAVRNPDRDVEMPGRSMRITVRNNQDNGTINRYKSLDKIVRKVLNGTKTCFKEQKEKEGKRTVYHRTNKDHTMVGNKIPLGSLVSRLQQMSQSGHWFGNQSTDDISLINTINNVLHKYTLGSADQRQVEGNNSTPCKLETLPHVYSNATESVEMLLNKHDVINRRPEGALAEDIMAEEKDLEINAQKDFDDAPSAALDHRISTLMGRTTVKEESNSATDSRPEQNNERMDCKKSSLTVPVDDIKSEQTTGIALSGSCLTSRLRMLSELSLVTDSSKTVQSGPVRANNKASRKNRKKHPYQKKKRRDSWSFDIPYRNLQELMNNLTTSSYQERHKGKLKPLGRQVECRFRHFRFRRSAVPEFLPESTSESEEFTEEMIPDFEERKKKAEMVDSMMGKKEEEEQDFFVEQNIYQSVDGENRMGKVEKVSSIHGSSIGQNRREQIELMNSVTSEHSHKGEIKSNISVIQDEEIKPPFQTLNKNDTKKGEYKFDVDNKNTTDRWKNTEKNKNTGNNKTWTDSIRLSQDRDQQKKVKKEATEDIELEERNEKNNKNVNSFLDTLSEKMKSCDTFINKSPNQCLKTEEENSCERNIFNEMNVKPSPENLKAWSSSRNEFVPQSDTTHKNTHTEKTSSLHCKGVSSSRDCRVIKLKRFANSEKIGPLTTENSSIPDCNYRPNKKESSKLKSAPKQTKGQRITEIATELEGRNDGCSTGSNSSMSFEPNIQDQKEQLLCNELPESEKRDINLSPVINPNGMIDRDEDYEMHNAEKKPDEEEMLSDNEIDSKWIIVDEFDCVDENLEKDLPKTHFEQMDASVLDKSVAVEDRTVVDVVDVDISEINDDNQQNMQHFIPVVHITGVKGNKPHWCNDVQSKNSVDEHMEVSDVSKKTQDKEVVHDQMQFSRLKLIEPTANTPGEETFSVCKMQKLTDQNYDTEGISQNLNEEENKNLKLVEKHSFKSPILQNINCQEVDSSKEEKLDTKDYSSCFRNKNLQYSIKSNHYISDTATNGKLFENQNQNQHMRNEFESSSFSDNDDGIQDSNSAQHCKQDHILLKKDASPARKEDLKTQTFKRKLEEDIQTKPEDNVTKLRHVISVIEMKEHDTTLEECDNPEILGNDAVTKYTINDDKNISHTGEINGTTVKEKIHDISEKDPCTRSNTSGNPEYAVTCADNQSSGKPLKNKIVVEEEAFCIEVLNNDGTIVQDHDMQSLEGDKHWTEVLLKHLENNNPDVDMSGTYFVFDEDRGINLGSDLEIESMINLTKGDGTEFDDQLDSEFVEEHNIDPTLVLHDVHVASPLGSCKKEDTGMKNTDVSITIDEDEYLEWQESEERKIMGKSENKTDSQLVEEEKKCTDFIRDSTNTSIAELNKNCYEKLIPCSADGISVWKRLQKSPLVERNADEDSSESVVADSQEESEIDDYGMFSLSHLSKLYLSRANESRVVISDIKDSTKKEHVHQVAGAESFHCQTSISSAATLEGKTSVTGVKSDEITSVSHCRKYEAVSQCNTFSGGTAREVALQSEPLDLNIAAPSIKSLTKPPSDQDVTSLKDGHHVSMKGLVSDKHCASSQNVQEVSPLVHKSPSGTVENRSNLQNRCAPEHMQLGCNFFPGQQNIYISSGLLPTPVPLMYQQQHRTQNRAFLMYDQNPPYLAYMPCAESVPRTVPFPEILPHLQSALPVQAQSSSPELYTHGINLHQHGIMSSLDPTLQQFTNSLRQKIEAKISSSLGIAGNASLMSKNTTEGISSPLMQNYINFSQPSHLLSFTDFYLGNRFNAYLNQQATELQDNKMESPLVGKVEEQASKIQSNISSVVPQCVVDPLPLVNAENLTEVAVQITEPSPQVSLPPISSFTQRTVINPQKSSSCTITQTDACAVGPLDLAQHKVPEQSNKYNSLGTPVGRVNPIQKR